MSSFLGELKKLGVNPEFTLTDKDWSEINAMQATWPYAKHQLCFWHGLRALKQRLAKNKEHPSYYDVNEALNEFSFIKTTFVPLEEQIDGHFVSKKTLYSQIYANLITRLLRLPKNQSLVFAF